MTEDLHVIAYRNTFLANEEGRYVLANILTRLGYFSKCETLQDMESRNVALEILENLGILFVENAKPEHAESSMQSFVDKIAGLNMMYLVEKQSDGIKKEQEDNEI